MLLIVSQPKAEISSFDSSPDLMEIFAIETQLLQLIMDDKIWTFNDPSFREPFRCLFWNPNFRGRSSKRGWSFLLRATTSTSAISSQYLCPLTTAGVANNHWRSLWCKWVSVNQKWPVEIFLFSVVINSLKPISFLSLLSFILLHKARIPITAFISFSLINNIAVGSNIARYLRKNQPDSVSDHLAAVARIRSPQLNLDTIVPQSKAFLFKKGNNGWGNYDCSELMRRRFQHQETKANELSRLVIIPIAHRENSKRNWAVVKIETKLGRRAKPGHKHFVILKTICRKKEI